MNEERYLAPIKFRWQEKLVYYTVWSIAAPFVYWYWRTKVEGLEHLRNLKGAAILAPTHRSAVDPGIAGLLTKRPLRPLAKVELLESKTKWLWKYMGACPVRRGEADREALRTAGAMLDAGELMIIFPEGTRKEGPTVAELHGGVGYLAAKHNVPVIPMAIAGSETALPKKAKFTHRAHVKVIVGEPIIPNLELGWKKASQEITRVLGERLQTLYDQSRGVTS